MNPPWCSDILNTMEGVSAPVAATPNTGEAVRQLRAARGVSVRGLAARIRSLEPRHYRRIARLRDDVQDLLDTEIAAAISAGDLAVNHRRDAGKAIATMCTALVQWFQPDGRTTPEQIAREYAQFALRLLGYNAVRQPRSRDLAPARLAGAATGSSQRTARSSGRGTGWLPDDVASIDEEVDAGHE